MHPQIKGGEFYTAYFRTAISAANAATRWGCSSPRRATRSSTSNSRPEGAHRGPRRHRHQTAGQGSRHFQHGTRGVCGLRRRQHQPHRSTLLDRRLPARAPAAGQLPQYAQHAGDVQEIRHETPLEGVRGVEGRPGRAAQRDDEVFPGAGELFDGRFFGEGDPPAGGRESFTRFRQEYEQDRDIRIEDEFGIRIQPSRSRRGRTRASSSSTAISTSTSTATATCWSRARTRRASSTKSITKRRSRTTRACRPAPNRTARGTTPSGTAGGNDALRLFHTAATPARRRTSRRTPAAAGVRARN